MRGAREIQGLGFSPPVPKSDQLLGSRVWGSGSRASGSGFMKNKLKKGKLDYVGDCMDDVYQSEGG